MSDSRGKVQTTSDQCAHCGMGAEISLKAPTEWEWYLMVEREIELSLACVEIPLCPSCYPKAKALKGAFHELGQYSSAEQDAIYADAHRFLDELSVAALENIETNTA